MQDNTFGYTNGEVHSLVAPLIGEQPENIDQVVMIALLKDGSVVTKGTEDAPKIIAHLVYCSLEESTRIQNGPDN